MDLSNVNNIPVKHQMFTIINNSIIIDNIYKPFYYLTYANNLKIHNIRGIIMQMMHSEVCENK